MDRDAVEERFALLETKLAYLEDFVERLQSEVVSRNAATERLMAEHAAVKEKMLQIAAELEEVPNRRPPHY
jgi:SlyX protein